MKKRLFSSLVFMLGLTAKPAFSDPELVGRNIFITALTSDTRKFVEYTVENLNDFDVKCRFIAVKAQYVDAQTNLDLGFRTVILRDLVVKANDRMTSVESGREIILELELSHPTAEIKTLNNSDADIRYSCDALVETPPSPPPPVEPKPTLTWGSSSATEITLTAGQALPELSYKALSNQTVVYSHGHPEDECSWDNPHQVGDQFVVSGRAPTSGRFTMNGKTLNEGSNVCRILLIANDGTQTISKLLTITIVKDSFQWISVPPDTRIDVTAGNAIPTWIFQASGGSSVKYSHGHPADECSWDRPTPRQGYLELSGTTPVSGRFTIGGKILQPGYNTCNIRIVATDANMRSIYKDVTVNIYVP